MFNNGRIVPISEFDRALRYVRKRINKDEYIYPPTEKDVETDLNWKPIRTVPRTKRPAHLYGLPASHELYVYPAKPEADIREGSAGFIIHLLAFLFRTRLQFSDWYFDGRIAMKRFSPRVDNAVQAGNYLSLAYKVWSGWPEKERKRFTNILYMFSRADIYRWEWEEFIIQYMVLDACWKMAEKLFGLRVTKHADRIKKLCDRFSLTQIQTILDIKTVVKLRNDLFHETLWHNGRPGSFVGRKPYHIPTVIGYYLNEPLIFALIEQSAKEQKLA
jgi:hypothetical protein